MSTFNGRMKECNRISIDRFDANNLLSTVFFLSHCHQDHMQGLGSVQFRRHLRFGQYRIYMHRITRDLLVADRRYSDLVEFIEIRDVKQSWQLEIPDRQSARSSIVTVTFLPAAHCPGSVMMLFEFRRRTALYTGDFRLNLADLKGMAALHYNDGSIKRIDSLYFDSTFCVNNTVCIPSRDESVAELKRLVSNWLNASVDNKILLWCSANYGHEFLMSELCTYLNNLPCHTTKHKFEIYYQIDAMRRFVTDLPYDARIHVCSFYDDDENEELPIRKRSKISTTNCYYRRKRFGWKNIPSCDSCKPSSSHVMVIKPSMMYFANFNDSCNISCRVDDRFYRLLYSSHSSFDEVCDMFRYLQPRSAYPNVIPRNSTENAIMQRFANLMQLDDDLEYDSDEDEIFCDSDNDDVQIISCYLANNCQEKSSTIDGLQAYIDQCPDIRLRSLEKS